MKLIHLKKLIYLGVKKRLKDISGLYIKGFEPPFSLIGEKKIYFKMLKPDN
jgi:hypothetical protein